MEREKIVQDFISAHGGGAAVKDSDPRFASLMEFDRLAYESPETAWELILDVLNRDQSEHIVGMLAAGPLEDLIEYHGPQFIERIETTARKDPAFRHALGGVWESNSPEIWARVESARVKSW